MTKACLVKTITFSSSNVWIWESDHKEGLARKNSCFQIVVLEKTLESPLDCKEIKSVNPKGNQPWILIGSTEADAEAPILWPPDWRANSLEMTLMLAKTESKMRRGWQRMRWLDSITDSMDRNLSKLWGLVEDRGSYHASIPLHLWSHRVSHDLVTEQQQQPCKEDLYIFGTGTKE